MLGNGNTTQDFHDHYRERIEEEGIARDQRIRGELISECKQQAVRCSSEEEVDRSYLGHVLREGVHHVVRGILRTMRAIASDPQDQLALFPNMNRYLTYQLEGKGDNAVERVELEEATFYQFVSGIAFKRRKASEITDEAEKLAEFLYTHRALWEQHPHLSARQIVLLARQQPPLPS